MSVPASEITKTEAPTSTVEVPAENTTNTPLLEIKGGGGMEKGPIRGNVTTGQQDLDDYDWEVTPELLAKWKQEDESGEAQHLHPMFMNGDDIPRSQEEFQKNPHLVALQELVYGEKSAVQVAEQFKNLGNEFLTDGSNRFQDAVNVYSKGLEEGADDDKLNAILYSNRAQAYLNLKKWSQAVDDARKAVGLDANNVKAFYRGGKGSFMMKLYRQSLKFCEGGLTFDPQNASLLSLKSQAEAKVKEIDDKRKAEEAERKKKEEEKDKVDSDFISVLKTKGVTVGHMLYNMGAHYTAKGKLNSEKQPISPLAVLYDEYCNSDFIEEVNLEDHTLMDHFSVLFPVDRCPEWDHERKYKKDNLRVFLEIPHEKADDNGTPVVMLIDANKPIIEEFKRAGRISRIPVVHVNVKGSEAEKAFLQTVHIKRN